MTHFVVSPRFNFWNDWNVRSVADFLAKPNLVTAVAKKLVPESISSTIRSALVNLNTGAKRQIDEKSRVYLRDFFAADVGEVEKLLGKKLNWLQ